MTRTYRHLVLHPLSVLLLLVAMVFTTAADAATCGAEVAPGDSMAVSTASYAEVGSSGDEEQQDDTGVPTDQDGICGHGHCHHSASVSGTVQMGQGPTSAAAIEPANILPLSSDENARLRRPPRA